MTHDQERRRQRFYDRGRDDAHRGDRMDQVERASLADTAPDYLAAYDDGRDGGPRPPLSGDFVIDVLSAKASGKLSHGERPQIVRLGRLESAALGERGLTGMQLTVHTSKTGSQQGHAYPSSQLVELSLRIERTDDDTRLEVS